MGHHNVGLTPRCAYQRTLKLAQERADKLNNSLPETWLGEVMTWGGSA